MSQASTVRVLVVDDQRVVREGLARLLDLLDGLEVVGAAADGYEALEAAGQVDPDVVLMDLDMPHMDGIEATRRLADTHPHLPVVVLTTYTDDQRVFAALRAGARGYLTKDAGAEEIESAIRTAAQGRAHLDSDVQRRLLELLTTGSAYGVAPVDGSPAPEAAPPGLPLGLTPREIDVLRHIAAGRSNTEIAAVLVVSTATVKTHINHLLAKTGSRDRAQLVRYAFRTGISTGEQL